MLESLPIKWVVYAFAAICGIIIAETIYLMIAGNKDKRATINRRIKLKGNKMSQRDVLVQLRKERGMDKGGHSILSMEKLRVLKTQSGLRMSLSHFIPLCIFISILTGLYISYKFDILYPAFLAPVVGATLLPRFVLNWRKKRRHKVFGEQFPEALDLIVRGLKAGHPVPVAVSMVGREMADPIGSEFGILTDELTYGSDMLSAMQSLEERVGHEDLPLFITAINIQSSTGGNLREILEGLAATIRERGKLKRKIRAVSTEGRMSAYILTALPCLLGLVLMVAMPDYYNSVIDKDHTWNLIGIAAGLLAFGNYVMSNMSNLKV
ncbi:MAG: type II secretion system F family protein [Hyphomicrobiales bacterium]|nr:type II secretion system F family protein [Hyphomicrobiales bacterium]